ncbi:hypothetical protein [Methanobacterium sp.]|uniref:hypothetical protein n=1 Tax=Methanobacterium sp. TaxID=2164 RepID=UPI002AB8180A|nr:hypothetical protein [Methanobacterium sp.]MDY9924651.1 hypothetical protein [Methanobacterium sp.]
MNGSSGLDTNDGYSWTSPKLTIQNATGTVSSNGTVTIADGVYSGYGNTNITVNRNMTIQGQSQSGTIINGTNTNWIFTIPSDVNVTIGNLTFTNGTGSRGGAILNHGDLTVENCTFTNNTATMDTYAGGWGGGAICNLADDRSITTTVTNCTFQNNNAYRGSAILNYCDISDHYIISTVTNCSFTNNTANTFGTIYNLADDGYINSLVTNCNFTNNTAAWDAGAIANYCRIGSITNTAINSTFSNNHADRNGGAIANWINGDQSQISINFTLINSTLTNNTANVSGGAIYNFNWCTRGSINTTAHFNSFVGNLAPTGSAIYNDNSSVNATLNWWGSNVDPTTVTNLISGIVDANPWVILSVNTTPSTIKNGETSAITADFNHINGGGDLVGGHIPDGPITLEIPWGSFTNSGISHSLKANTVAGAMSATFYASEGALNPLFNPVQVSATADDYTTSDAEAAYISINPVANLNITNTANVTAVNAGDIVKYNITITNNGQDNVTIITLKDILPVGTELVSVSSAYDILSPIPSGIELTWNNILASLGVAQLQPGMNVSIWVDARILASAAGTTLVNKANITYNAYPYFNESTTNVYVNQATVELNKTVNNTRPNVGETVLFTIVAKNTGTGTASNLIVTDTLPAGLDFVNCTGGGVWDPVTRTITWPAAIVANNGNITYYLTALVNSTSLAGTNITNVVNETHTEYPNNSTTNCTIYVPKADLYIQITSDKNNPNVGETFTLTYKLGNNGPNTANNMIVTYTLPAGLDFVNCTGGGVWDPVTRTVTWPAAIVANNGNVTYYLTALVNSTGLAGTNVTNVVNETHSEYPNNSTTNCTVYVPKADLYIQITSDKNNPNVGETFTLTYKLGNNGPDTADNVTITIPLPEGFVISKIEGDGNWTVTGNTITWTMNNVTVGDPNLYISGWTTGPGNHLFTASITSDTFNINSMGVSPLTLNAQPTVNAATTTNTVGMQTTGTPIVPLAIGILSVLGGLAITRKKQ